MAPERPASSYELSLADHACLAIIAEGPTHGWAIVKLLAPGAELGAIWSLSRPLTYRSIDRLVAADLVRRNDRGRRAELTVTATGVSTNRAWLDRPVGHLRELRTEFLLKLALRDRVGLGRRSFARSQLDELRPAVEALTAGDGRTIEPVTRWRRESALASQRFLTALADDD